MPFQPVVRYPEWKTLTDRIDPLLDAGQTRFTYEELAALAGIDVRSDRGRGQFYKFRRNMLKTRRVWFEVLKGEGYEVVPADDQPRYAGKRMDQSRRKLAMGRAINTFVRFESMSPEQRLAQAGMAAVFDNLGRAFHQASRDLRRVSNADLTKIDGSAIIAAIKRSA